ncbi:MAG TPA: hypothetical protein VNO79_08055 [Actinomycetota bacterium]|nr:hypothetical protein [Actinomycetota bacterium]
MRRAGLVPEVDPERRWARARRDDLEVEVGFRTGFRIFGVFVDTVWTGRRQGAGEGAVDLDYRFGWRRPGRFVARSGGDDALALAERLNRDAEVGRLVGRAEVGEVTVRERRGERRVQLRPMAGTITALYVPPLPPYTVPLRAGEADAQLALVLRLLSA